MRTVRGRWAVALLLVLALVAHAGTPPPWWSTQGVLVSGGTASDYAAVNTGQVKQIAYGAYKEMETKVPGGAGSTLTSLINAWLAAPASGVTRNDYAAVNLGQLKAIAKPFYDRLAAIGYHGAPLATGQTYPWDNSQSAANDYAMANIGQVKNLFSFNLAVSSTDTDGNGLPDAWEMKYFGKLGNNPNDDVDGDGLLNWEEAMLNLDPTKKTDGIMPTLSTGTPQVVLVMPDGTYRGVGTDWSLIPVTAP